MIPTFLRVWRMLLLVAVVAPGAARAQAAGPGSKAEALTGRAGHWIVTETVWSRPGVAPAISTGLVAERRMVGSFLQEQILPANAVSGPSGSTISALIA